MKFSIIQFFNSILPISFFTVSGDSMRPALLHGTRVITIKLLPIKKGDIVVFKKPITKQIFIKRVIQVRSIGNQKSRLNRDQSSIVKKKEYYVLGDNVKESTDSRDFGWIQKKDILGKVIYTHIHVVQ